MGRTRRRRLIKKQQVVIKTFDKDPNIIDLNRWMKHNLWYNETKLKIASFPQIGRGVMTTKKIECGDIIIELPYKLMITYTTVEKSESFKLFMSSFTEQISLVEMLSLYIMLEHHLEGNSFWSSYFNSLPTLDELTVLWLCSEEEMGYLNDDLSILVRKERNTLDESWSRVKSLLNSEYTCQHCDARAANLMTRDLYTWAYIIVCTRCVYVDPQKVRSASTKDLSHLLSDEPSVALCPFLDMFNHSSSAHTTAYLSDLNGILNYFLVTNSNFKKYDQVFISYGNHNNNRLLYQYGFVLPRNKHDSIEFSLKEILTISKISCSSRQYKFICDRDFDKIMYVTYSGCSFNMESVLYVLTNENEVDWTVRIFSSEYTKEHLRAIYSLTKQLLEFKLNQYKHKLEQLTTEIKHSVSRHFQLYFTFLNNQILFIKEGISEIEVKYNL